MIKRPSNKDSENDILRMQQEFFAETNRDANFQPAAKFVRIRSDHADVSAAGTSSSNDKASRQSEFARRRQLKKNENKLADKPSVVPENTIIGDIVERRYSHQPVTTNDSENEDKVEGSFPKPIHLKVLPKDGGKNKSLFAQMFDKGGNVESPGSGSKKVNVPKKSIILEGNDALEIHEENVQKLQQMNEEEILLEKNHLMNTMDPKLVEFLKSRRRGVSASEKPAQEPIQEVDEIKQELPDLDVLRQDRSDQWINFDILELEKLEWTKNIQQSLKELKPGETYEARFDWKGVLQPYVAKGDESNKDDRELYLHGDEAERPGYTLQELFRLARANVLQQRISSLNAIGGILNILNQGFYDGVLELPISKIFFFLRFALDENTPSVVEAASRSLAYLFYNDTDETMLDAIYDTEKGIYQPELGLNITHSREEEAEQRQKELEKEFDTMKLHERKQMQKRARKVQFSAEVEEDPDDIHNRETMNDFHLAETDLLECLMRTNILERIRYILFTMRPEGTTAVSCTKLLIRLARTNESMAVKIASNDQLIGGLVGNYLGSIEGFDKYQPQHVVIKLLRVLCSYGNDFYDRFLARYHVTSLLKRYVFCRRDINVRLIQTQIETFRFMRLYLKCTQNDEMYCELLPALFYLLEWHYQHLVLDENGPFIIRQHCASLLALIGYDRVQHVATVFSPQNWDRLFACFSKWFNGATKYGVNEFSQKLLLGACLDVAAKVRSSAMTYYCNFFDGYLSVFVKSTRFEELMKQLSQSPLLSVGPGLDDRSEKIASLPNLGAILTRENHPTAPTLILTKSYPPFMLQAMLGLLRSHAEVDALPLQLFIDNRFHFNYLIKLAGTVSNRNRNITSTGRLLTNWFLKGELNYVLDVLSLLVKDSRYRLVQGTNAEEGDVDMEKDEQLISSETPANKDGRLLLAMAFKVLLHLSEDFYPAIVRLFDEVLFVRNFYYMGGDDVAAEDLQRWKFNYKVKLRTLVKNAVNLSGNRNTYTIIGWRIPLLDSTWPYSLLYLLLEKLEQGPAAQLQNISEEQIIKTSLLFSELLEHNCINLTTITNKLMYLMTAFLGPDSKFLDDDISALITRRIDSLRAEVQNNGERFDFDTRLEGRKSYHGLYQLVLDIFQSSSYGHEPFSALVMVPLAQQYDIQWRNLVWSEHVAVLRFITCSEQQLFGRLEDYLQPEETDTTLIRCYSQALNSNLLRPGSVPARIAAHHVQAYRAKVDKRKQDNDNDK